MNLEHYPFSLIPLNYPYDALLPYIDTETMQIHHNKHLKKYVDNLNNALALYPKYHMWSLPQLINNICLLPYEIQTAVKNNAGGVYNHNLYFSVMNKPSDNPSKPHGNLISDINRTFGSFNEFRVKFNYAALNQFGSGWAWLVMNPCGKLEIVSTSNQDTPLPNKRCPILIVDVWEHAYYLKYQNRRADYLENWWNVIDWDIVLKNYTECLSKK